MTSSPTPAINHDMAELTDDMRPTDLVEVLQHLPWRGGCTCVVRLDRGMVRFLIGKLQQQH